MIKDQQKPGMLNNGDIRIFEFRKVAIREFIVCRCFLHDADAVQSVYGCCTSGCVALQSQHMDLLVQPEKPKMALFHGQSPLL